MRILPGFWPLLAVLCSILPLNAQVLPGSVGFSIEGSFVNSTPESDNSLLLSDNDLTNGYRSGFDLHNAPASLASSGPTGAAAFQWGEPSSHSDYPHSSSLWFEPLTVANVMPESHFKIGHLYYRNGTIRNNTGASWVDLALKLSFNQPLGLDPVEVTFGSELVNTRNSSDPVSSADIVSLNNHFADLDFTDNEGNRYYLELAFLVDQDTIDGTLSSANQFKVFEGSQGRATLVGRFTTEPVLQAIPEPSGAIIGLVGSLLFLRRRR